MEANVNYGDEIRMTSGGEGRGTRTEAKILGESRVGTCQLKSAGGEKVELCQAQRAYMHHI